MSTYSTKYSDDAKDEEEKLLETEFFTIDSMIDRTGGFSKIQFAILV